MSGELRAHDVPRRGIRKSEVKTLQLRYYFVARGVFTAGINADWSLRCMTRLHIDGTTGRSVLRKMQSGRLLCDSKGTYEQEGEWEAAANAIHTYLQVRA